MRKSGKLGHLDARIMSHNAAPPFRPYFIAMQPVSGRWASLRSALVGVATVAAVVAIFAGLPANADTADSDSPIGRWQTFDDRTHAPKGMVRIYEHEGKLFGRIERPPARKNDADVCAVCTDDRKDQPIDGLLIIRNMNRSSEDPLEWSGGDILDPETGRLYRLTMRVEERGAKLAVRGFFGFSLLGRTQTWSRIP